MGGTGVILRLVVMISIVIIYNIRPNDAIWIEVPSTGTTKCVSEDIKQNIVVIADFSLVSVDDISSQLLPIISAKVFLLNFFYNNLFLFSLVLMLIFVCVVVAKLLTILKP